MQQDSQNGLVLLSFANFIIISIPLGMLGVAWPSIQETFGVSLDALGILLLAGTAGQVSSSFLSGWLTQRFGLGKYLFFNNCVQVAGLLGYVLAPSWWWFVGAGFVHSAGAGAIDAGLNSYFAANHTARLMNWLHAAFGIGVTIGPLILTAVLAQNLSWRLGYLAGLVLVGVVTLVYGLTLRWWAAVVAEEAAIEVAETAVSAASLFRMGIIWLSMALFFLAAGVEGAAGSWAFTLFSEGRGIDVATAGLWTSIYWGSFTIGRIFYGIVGDRFNTTNLLRLNMVGVVVGTGLLWWNPLTAVSFFGLALMGFALAPIFPLLVLETPNRISSRFASSAIGFQVGAAGLGLALLPGGIGLAADQFGLEWIGALLVVGALLQVGVHEWILAHSKA